MKNILSFCAVQNQATGWVWSSGHLPLPPLLLWSMEGWSVHEPLRWGTQVKEPRLEVRHSGSMSPLSTWCMPGIVLGHVG